MTSYRWRSYILELVAPSSAGVMYLENIGQVRRLLDHLAPACAHGAQSITYRLFRVWLDNGFEVAPAPSDAIRFPSVLESPCVCDLAKAIA